jgi:hypothetical protein
MFELFERQMFKPTTGGYIFQPPPPTRFHHTQSYVVDEAQKEEIQAITRRGRTFWMRTVTLTAMALAVAAGVLIDKRGGPFWLAIFVGVCFWLIAQVLGMALALHLKLRQLEPVLAGLPRSDERLFPAFDRSPAPRYIAIWCALFAFLLGQRFEQYPPFTDLLTTLCLAALVLNLFLAFRGGTQTR